MVDNGGPQAIPDWATNISRGVDALNEFAQALEFIVTSDNNALFTIQLAPNAFGTATVTSTLRDDAGGADTSAEQTFTIRVRLSTPTAGKFPQLNNTAELIWLGDLHRQIQRADQDHCAIATAAFAR